MSLKNSIFALLILSVFAQSLLFAQDTRAKTTSKPGPISFDVAVPRFEDTPKGKEYIKKFGHKPDIADAFGYPMPETKLKQQKPKVERRKILSIKKPILRPGPKVLPKKFNPNVNKKTTLIERLFDLFIPSAVAYDDVLDSNGNHTGIVNCRDVVPVNPNDPNNPGYFRAYFEDLAYNNGNGSGVGYDHPQLGSGRRLEVCEVLEEIADILMMNEPGGATPEILFSKDLPPNTPTNALASASPYFGISSFSSGFLHEHIITRNDPASGPDAKVNTNWDPSVSWSVDSSLNPGTFDFKTVMRHEVFHALGFMSRLPLTIFTTNVSINHNHWDKNLYSPTTSYFVQGLNPLLQVPVGAPSQWFTNNTSTYQGRKNYVNAPLDPARPLYTPSSAQPGSTVSHFDMARLTPPNSENYVMHPSITPGVLRDIHQHEKEVLCHLGYRVRSMPNCTTSTPFAVDDDGMITSTVTHIPFVMNDFSSSGFSNPSNLALHSIFFFNAGTVTPFTSFSLDPNTPAGQPAQFVCSGTQTTLTAGNAKCLTVSTPNSVSLIRANYQVRDLVTNQISNIAAINYSRCVVSTDEHICNGDFELGQPQMVQNSPFWTNAQSSTDIVIRNGTVPQTSITSIPLINNSTSTIINDFNNSLGNRGIHLYSYATPGYFDYEAISAKLKKNVLAGSCYEFKYDAILVWIGTSTNPNLPSYLKFRLLNFNPGPYWFLDNSTLNSSPALHTFTIPRSIGGIVPWNNYSMYFSPSTNFEYVALTHESGLGEGISSLYLDNVSLKNVDSSFCSANQNNQISGVVYNDNVITNGQINLTEPVLDGVLVKLYDVQNNLINQSITDISGTYNFLNLNPAVSYKVVIGQENQYSSITEPLANNPFSQINFPLISYQYTRVVPFTNGGIVTGENFGVILQGQSPKYPPTISSSQMCSSGGSLTAILPPFVSGTISYAWSGPNGFTSNQQTIAMTTNGTYTVNVTSTNGYSESASLTVQLPVATVISGTISQPTSGTNGSINLSVTGQGPFTYQWSNGQTSQNLTNVGAGSYSVTVTNPNGCSSTANFIISNVQNGICCKVKPNANPVINCSEPFMNLDNLTVQDGYNLCVQANGGNSCMWDVTNPKCCFPGAPGCLMLTPTAKPACDGKSGGIALALSGGTPPYTYLWSNGQTTQNATNIAPGTYTVTVTAANGVTATATVTLPSIGPVTINGSVTYATAPSFNNGAINISVTPVLPAPGYTFNWIKVGGGWPGSTSEDIQNLTVGSYSVTAKNTFGCQASKTFKVIKALKPVGSEVIKKQ